ncbi:MAG: helicase-related protein [Candidatus Nanoarchaeia archaeon]|nr:helicase-related protein [Candidatus Nanoarchaeia archaeon]
MPDPTFITNEGENTLENLFNQLIRNTKFFDCLVGYFYPSGFFRLYKELENVEKIRILIGIGTNQQALNMLSRVKENQLKLIDSSAEIKKELDNKIVSEYEDSRENEMQIEEGTKKFIEWVTSGKMQIKAYPAQNLHAKLYIFTSKGGGFGDEGRVVHGSSNLTEAGLNKNLEFNSVHKEKRDYDYALQQFESLWKSAIDVSERFVQTIKHKTWINSELSPYHLFLKFLYEYLKERVDEDLERLGEDEYKPENYLELKYQLDAVRDARSKLLGYGGVFISDVVGLGKTYIATMLAKELEFIDGKNAGTLVVAPPVLLDENNPGSWKRAFNDFGIRRREFVSRGMLDEKAIEKSRNCRTVIIDESHGFRNEATKMYEQLFRICRGKRVILVSATPLNNSPLDILSQIKLFQNIRNSTIPGMRNLDKFFNSLDKKLRGLDRLQDKEIYIKIIKENSKEIREKVLKYIMVRRTRSEIIKYFSEDLERVGLKFPEVEDPTPAFYKLNKEEDEIFNETIRLITQDFRYARYTPLLYLKPEIKLSQPEELSQKNMRKFMKVLLIKRLESSFYAFRMSIDRFIQYYQKFIESYNKDRIPVSKKYAEKFFEYLEDSDEDAIKKLEEIGELTIYKKSDFNKDFIKILESDLVVLKKIETLWKKINRDPKINKLSELLAQDKIIKKSKVILFTESKETANYLKTSLPKEISENSLVFSGESHSAIRDQVIQNFDANAITKKNDFKVLISTEVLSEGVNLHRSNIVINYDIPWNPTRMIQRVGRVNRVGTAFDTIYTYNFFPTIQSNNQIKLKEAAEAKIHAFIEMLGADARLLTQNEELNSFTLFNRLTSKKTITGEDSQDEQDIELKWLTFLRKIRDSNTELYNKVIKLPKKARTSRKYPEFKDSGVITFFKKGKLKKIFLSASSNTKELDLADATKLLVCNETTKPAIMDKQFFSQLEKNKEAFDSVFEIEESKLENKGRRIQ